jgi:linearmycin/streptolysin S transport system permease protein
MRSALVITTRILRQRLRDRSAIIFAVLTPLGLALAFSALIPNDFQSFHTTYIVVDKDGGHLSQVLVDDVLGQLVKAGVADVHSVATQADGIAEVKADRASAVIVIPAGFTDAIQRGAPTELRLLGSEYTTSVEIARAALARFASDIDAVQLMVVTTTALGGTADAATIGRAQQAMAAPAPISITDSSLERLQANLGTTYGAAMAIMFVFFATQYGALALLADKQVGTLNRLLAAPVSPAMIILGSSLAGLVLGLVSMTILAVATTLLVHANWGPPPLVALLLVAAVIAAMGISTLVSTLARTVQQAGSLNAIVALSMAAVGGVFIPLSQAPEILVNISLATPHAWFLRAINTLSGANATLADIAPSLGVLLGMGLVTGAIGLARAQRSLVPA